MPNNSRIVFRIGKIGNAFKEVKLEYLVKNVDTNIVLLIMDVSSVNPKDN